MDLIDPITSKPLSRLIPEYRDSIPGIEPNLIQLMIYDRSSILTVDEGEGRYKALYSEYICSTSFRIKPDLQEYTGKKVTVERDKEGYLIFNITEESYLEE